MKFSILVVSALFSLGTFAQTIKGTMVLKGEVESETQLNGVKVKCSLKVNKVKNDLIEDSFGNPAYRVQIKVSLSGKKINLDKEYSLSNMFTEGSKKIVKDEIYSSADGLFMKIDVEGRVRSVEVPYKNLKVTCAF